MSPRLLVFVLSWNVLAETWVSEPVVEVTPRAVQGGWVTVTIRDYARTEGWNARFRVRFLTSHGQELVSRTSFPIQGGFGDPTQGFLIGVFLDWPAGDYSVEVSSERTGWMRVLPVRIDSHRYPRLDLRLNRALTRLLTRPDPRREREREEFWQIMNTYEAYPAPWVMRFQSPVIDQHRISSPFGERRNYIYEGGGGFVNYHWGIDYAAPVGTPIYAPAPGRVILAADRVVGGNSIFLEHKPGVISIFYHCDSLAVTTGQWVEAGQLLGTIGSTGLSTGPHLHWEVRVHGIPVNPAWLVEQGLPLARSIPQASEMDQAMLDTPQTVR